jgi:hypothetical protein
MIFTEGTILGPKNILEYFFCSRYIPIGGCVGKIRCLEEQGAEILYCTSRKREKNRNAIADILRRYHFPGTRLYYRAEKQRYKDIIEEVMPDILIEDDCKSLGGAWQMCITDVKPEVKGKIKSIVVKEFVGLDSLPVSLTELKAGR